MTPALAILELSSIARGVIASDALVKRAPVTLLQSRPVSSGKHLLVFGGPVAEVEEALAAGKAIAADALVDELYLSFADSQLAPLLAGDPPRISIRDSVAVFETTTVCAAVRAADAAAKAAEVTLMELRLAAGIGGKAYFTMTGELHAIEASVAAGRDAIAANRIINVEVIAAPHDDIKKKLLF
jgi:microcompartment protein CcmL/EutN